MADPVQRAAGNGDNHAQQRIADHAADAGRQRPVGGARQAGRKSAAAKTPPAIQAATRQPIRSSRRCVNSRQPQNAGRHDHAMVARPNSCMARSAAIAPGAPSRLRTARRVAWLKLGSLTDQVASAAAAVPTAAISARPTSSRRRRCTAARKSSDRNDCRRNCVPPSSSPRVRLHQGSFTKSVAGLLLGPQLQLSSKPKSAEHGDDAVQRLGRGLLVMHHGDADEVRAGIAAVGLVARRVAAGQDPHAGLAPQPRRRGLAAAMSRQRRATGRSRRPGAGSRSGRRSIWSARSNFWR